MFLRFLEHGLAYRQKSPVDWCPNDGTLAREQVEGADRRCWRCGALVEKRDLDQWYLRTTAYADELLRFDGIDWPEPIRIQQTNWIGRSEGAEIDFDDRAVRPPRRRRDAARVHDPPGHAVRGDVHGPRPRASAGRRPDRARPAGGGRGLRRAGAPPDRDRATVDRPREDRRRHRRRAINPVNGERIPIFIADYVLSGYGTGAIMAVPAHDERDFAFAEQFGLPIRRVVAAPGTAADDPMDDAYIAHAADERLVNSGDSTGCWPTRAARRSSRTWPKQGAAEPKVTYRLRDWLISRQRYWGTPIPVVYCATDGIVPVRDEDLPVRLPEDVDYPGSGTNPLTQDEAFLHTTCPRCGGPARRETDTMDTFVDSSWYWFRYLSPEEDDGPVDRAMADRWTPVDQYTGGAEHAVMHLLYSRFWTKAMRDVGLIGEDEPFLRLFNQGQILGADGERMSKSRGNVQDPDELVARYGADSVRLFLMFMGPWDQGGPWSPTGIGGVHRFLNRVWTLALDPHGREAGDPDAGNLPAGEAEADADAGSARRHIAPCAT